MMSIGRPKVLRIRFWVHKAVAVAREANSHRSLLSHLIYIRCPLLKRFYFPFLDKGALWVLAGLTLLKPKTIGRIPNNILRTWTRSDILRSRQRRF
jgi:hypothetical protein